MGDKSEYKNLKIHASYTFSDEQDHIFIERKWVFAFFLLFLFVISSILIVHFKKQAKFIYDKSCFESPDRLHYNESVAQEFSEAAVVTENARCSFIGKKILLNGGSAVDAAIASAICLGVVSMQGCGIGGGSFMLIHNRSSKDGLVIDSRETSPLKSHAQMFIKGYKYSYIVYENNRNDTTFVQTYMSRKSRISLIVSSHQFDALFLSPNSNFCVYLLPNDKTLVLHFDCTDTMKGGLSIAVPGEIAGYWKAHQMFGKIPWKNLFLPTIKLCKEGFQVSRSLAKHIQLHQQFILRDPVLSTLFVKNQSSRQLYAEGDVMKHPKLGATLQTVANEGADAFYSGSIAKEIVEEIQNAGGIITYDDLEQYVVKLRHPLVFRLESNRTLITVPPPAGGSIVAFVLKVMQDFKLTDDEISLPYQLGTFYHKFAEALKFAFARKERLSDPDFPDPAQDCRDILSELYLSYAKAKIDEQQTHPVHYYGLLIWSDEQMRLEGGTTHVNVVSKEQVVSMTSSINNGFGSKLLGSNTGIMYNNHMNDFWVLGTTYKTCSANIISPLRRPMSYMSPSIVLEADSVGLLTVGGSGGSLIPAAVAQVIIRVLWFHQSLKVAVDSRRFAHILVPELLLCEKGYDQKILTILSEKGHNISCYDPNLSTVYTAVEAIQILPNGKLVAYCDPRKGGSADGF